MAIEPPVPESRLSRLAHLGRLAGGTPRPITCRRPDSCSASPTAWRGTRGFRYRAADGQLQLLDFGATREYPAPRREVFRDLMRGSIDGDEAAMTRAAVAVGYIADADPAAHQASTLALLRAVTEPARVEGRYDFGSADLAARLGEMLVRLRLHERFSRIPPPDALFLHRKLGGLYLLLTRLRARIDVRASATGR